MKLLTAIAAATAIAATSARADILSVGFIDLDTPNTGIITLDTIPNAGPGSQIQFIGNPLVLGTGFGFDQIIAALIPASQSGLGNGTNPTFEFAFNDGFVPPQGGTFRLYASWQGAVDDPGALILPSIMQTKEFPSNSAGLFVSEQIFVCPLGGVFCDNFLVGGGTLVGDTTIFDQNVTTFPTFTGISPGQLFTVTEVFTVGQDRGTFPNSPVGNFAGAILTSPISVHAVPGPVVGAGLPGLIFGALGWLWRRKTQVKPSRS
jgi:hypothetical protein